MLYSMTTTKAETAEQTLIRITRKLRHWERNLAANERRYVADGTYSDVTLARVRAELDIVRDALEQLGEAPNV